MTAASARLRGDNMSVSKCIPLAILAGLLLSHPSFGAGDENLVWGENVGFVLASRGQDRQ